MAESASTGNSGTTGAGSQSTSTTSTSTSTSTSNGGPAASGSQTSSNGSFSTGKGSGNNGVGPGLSFGAGVTSNSNGNFSGGLPGMAPGFAGFAASNFGQGWGSGNGGSSTNDNKTEPVMTVDEVYGKGNQSIVESQGDYEATSNEKSNVETSTFGKQDEISVTPVSVTENKGLVNNDAIQSVEGLNFQQKDKANQEVMEAKKSRDEAEAEDNANGMRDQLKAVAEKDAEETDAFQVGEEASSKEKAALDEAAQAYKDLQAQVDGKLAEFNEASNKYVMAREAAKVADQTVRDQTAKMNEAFDNEPDAFEPSSITTLKDGNEITVYTYRGKDPSVKAANDARNKAITELSNAQSQLDASRAQYNAAKSKYNQYIESYNEAKTNLDKATEAYNNTFVGAPTTEAPSYKANIEAARNEINNAKDLSDEQKSEATSVLGNVESAADAMNDAAKALAANPNDINAVQQYVEETARYNKALKDAKGNNALKNTDFNKTFTKAVADANNFMVTRDDGTQQNYAEFAAEMATKSPELAKGLYEAKAKNYEEQAKNYEENGHKVLAAMKTAKSKIETAKSKMVMTWLGSKFTFADNQVRSQFNQMAKTDMRATYATYNNVLNDPNAKPEKKAEASAAINQANSLMTASAALQASTGFLSGIGDSPSDGVYGVTDPGKLNGYQEALNAASNFAKITLGLGVTPGANEAYQNMYYLAGDKAKNSILFGRDFDGDGFALCQEYGNNAAVGMIAGAGELAVGVALMFNPATSKMGINLAIDSVKTFFDGLYGVQKEVNKSIKYSNEVLNYFNEAKSIAAETGNKEATSTMDSAIKQIEDFQLKSDEVGNLDNWLEGSGSNTADNGKFNQALSYDEWLKLIEADPVMQEYAKSLNR